MIKAYTNDYYGWWDQYLEGCLFAYRISKHASINYSPFFLIYGRDPIIPINISLENNLKPRAMVIDESIGERIRRVVMRSLDTVRKNNERAKQNQSKYYNRNIKNNKPIKPNDFILLKNQSKAKEDEYNKFLPNWIGPFKVLEVLSEQTIKIAIPLEMAINNLQSIKNCKLYKHRMAKLLCNNPK
ncbi:hypothetical protein ACTFIU_004376 [Dictyostelium citrinum]